jgi:hypothetical protein
MKRREFLWQGSILATGLALLKAAPGKAAMTRSNAPDLYAIFKDPAAGYRPFVRWWWNGDKVERTELARELRLMKEAGIGGVEINPIKFPAATDDMGKPAIEWLSPEWVDLLDFTLKEAASLGLTCDLIVGSGWPFGAEYLEREERSQMMVVSVLKLDGPQYFEVSPFAIFSECDPAVTSPFPGRTMELLSAHLAPALIERMDQVTDLSSQIPSGEIKTAIPPGKHVLYALVKVSGSMQVINGAPGANGPVLNHYNEAAVKKYLHRMSETIRQRIGTLAGRVRSFFTDSMELEGSNWCADMQDEFKKRKGYDLLPYLPLVLSKTGSMGNVYDFNYGPSLGAELKDKVERVRYDFEMTKSELIRERFIRSFTDWCKDNKVLSRVQAYGRGYFPLEGSFDIDLPECETWIKYGLGEEMSEEDYHTGRAYTMINKYVSSAAHLKGKRLISCEELTNTDMVFNSTLEMLKLAGDQSTISGVTHPVFHGFNYSPPDAAFPGWIRYGTYFNERNTWWPYFKKFTDYKARLSALLLKLDMFADIAVLPPVADMWSLFGAQNEPFPSLMYPVWLPLVWEAMHKNGNACDYISEQVILEAVMNKGWMQYGQRKYHTIFLVRVQRLGAAVVRKLHDFVSGGGRIFCIETVPDKCTGWDEHERQDADVRLMVESMKRYPDNFILLEKPEKDWLKWYRDIQNKYGITPYVKIGHPDPFVTQIRYQGKKTEVLFFINSHKGKGYSTDLNIQKDIAAGRQAWVWDPETGQRWHIGSNAERVELDLGPAESRLIVFDHEKPGSVWKSVPAEAEAVPGTGAMPTGQQLAGNWTSEFRHIDGSVRTANLNELQDLKDSPEWVSFCGSVTYRLEFNVGDTPPAWLNLGKLVGVNEAILNGKALGVKWYGRRIYPITGVVQSGRNVLEVKVVTSMGNYMKTLKNNPVAQYWTNEKRKDQPIQSMGLIGPVTIY